MLFFVFRPHENFDQVTQRRIGDGVRAGVVALEVEIDQCAELLALQLFDRRFNLAGVERRLGPLFEGRVGHQNGGLIADRSALTQNGHDHEIVFLGLGGDLTEGLDDVLFVGERAAAGFVRLT